MIVVCWTEIIISHLLIVLHATSSSATSSGNRPEVANHSRAGSSPKEATEYCELESFQPQCPADHVIQVTEARYGLVSLGRCLAADFGYVGCFADVINYVGARCSGRRFCLQEVPDKFLSAAATKCRPEFKSFLLASYRCVPVGTAGACRSCHTDGSVRLNAAGTDGSGGYVASVLSAERQDDNGCGGTRCPWIIEAQPGQVINLTLYEFNAHLSSESGPSPGGGSRSRVSGLSDPCPGSRFAIIKERANPRDFSVCGGSSASMIGRHVFTSVSNVVELQIVSAEALAWKLQFMIRYEAVGCPDVVPPANGWSRRIESRMELGCTSTGRQWTLTCVGSKWTGDVTATCDSSAQSSSSSFNIDRIADQLSNWYRQVADYASSVPLGILVTTVASIILVLLVIIITCCFVCIKRRRYKVRYRHAADNPNSTVSRRPDAAAYDANQCGAFGGCGGQLLYQQKMVPNTPMACKVHNPDWTTTTAADESTDDANKYVCGGPTGGANAVMDNRPLPSLPRRQGNDGSGVGVTGSLISNASGSDASLHWGDTPPRPNDAATRDDAALFNQQTSSRFQQQQQHMTQQPAWQSLGGVSDPRQCGGVAPEQEDDYLTPRTISSTVQTAASAMQNSAVPHAMALQQPLPPSVADQNGMRQWYPHQQLPPQQQQQQQQLWRQHPRLLARVSFPAVAVTDDPAMQCGIADPSQTMPRTTHVLPGGAVVQSNGDVISGRPGGRLQ